MLNAANRVGNVQIVSCILSFGFGFGRIVFMVATFLCIKYTQGDRVEHPGKFYDLGLIRDWLVLLWVEGTVLIASLTR